MNSIIQHKIIVQQLKLVYLPIKDINFQYYDSWQIAISKQNNKQNIKFEGQYVNLLEINQFLERYTQFAHHYKILVNKCIIRNNYIIKNHNINIKKQILIHSIKPSLTLCENKNLFIKSKNTQTTFSRFLLRKSINLKNQKKFKTKLFEQKRCVQPYLQTETKSIQQIQQIRSAVINQKKTIKKLVQQKQSINQIKLTLPKSQINLENQQLNRLKSRQTVSDHKQKQSNQIIKFCRSFSPVIYNLVSKKVLELAFQKPIITNKRNKINKKQLIPRFHKVITSPSILNRKNQYLMSFQRMKSAVKHQTNSCYSTFKLNKSNFYGNLKKCLQISPSGQITNQYDDQNLIIIKSYKQFRQKNNIKKLKLNQQQKLTKTTPTNLNIHTLLSKRFKDNKFKKKEAKINFIDQQKNQFQNKNMINHYSQLMQFQSKNQKCTY